MMPHAKLMHAGSGFCCERLERELQLGLGLDGSSAALLPLFT